jgi:hypothetical protein
MTADTTMLARADRQRLLERVGELADLDRLMREPGTMAEPDEPVPLHRRRTTKFSTESITKFSTTERTRP